MGSKQTDRQYNDKNTQEEEKNEKRKKNHPVYGVSRHLEVHLAQHDIL